VQITATSYQPSALALSRVPEKNEAAAGADHDGDQDDAAPVQSAKPANMGKRVDVLA